MIFLRIHKFDRPCAMHAFAVEENRSILGESITCAVIFFASLYGKAQSSKRKGGYRMRDDSRVINRVFSTQVLDDLLSKGHSDVFDCAVARYVPECEQETIGEVFEDLYRYLQQHQRNEYFYQNTVFRSLLVRHHSPRTTVAFRQMRIGKSIADFVMVNGEGKAYELKSDLDNFERLEGQLRGYLSAFSYASVVVSEQQYERTLGVIDAMSDFGPSIGVYKLTKRHAISSICRNPKRYNGLLSHEALFKLLRKDEYEGILLSVFHSLPREQPVRMFRACLEWFSQLEIANAQQLTMSKLKERRWPENRFPTEVQRELQSVVYFADNRYDESQLQALLSQCYQKRR